MIRNPFDHSRHVSIETLTRLQDGELPSAAAEEARQHLEICWQCRNRAERIAATVRAFVNYCDAVVDGLRESETGWGGGLPILQARLARQTRERERPSRLPSSPFWRRATWAGLLCPQSLTSLTAIVLVGYWFFFTGAGPRAEAAEVLFKASRGEQARLEKLSPRMVVRQKFEIRHGGETGQWELWRNPVQNRLEQRWSGSKLMAARVRQIYESNGLDHRAPLSVQEFAAWHKRAGVVDEQVTHAEDGSQVDIRLAKRDAGGPLQIRSASMTLREPDLHPLAQSLTLAGRAGGEEETMEVREVALELLPLQPAPPATASATPVVREMPAVVPEPPPAAPSPEDLERSEALLREAIHSTGLQGRLTPRFRIEAGRVVLQVIVESPEQKAQIEAASRDIPHVDVQIWEPDGDMPSLPAMPAPPAVRAPLARTAPPLDDFLREYFGNVDLTNQYIGQVQRGIRASLASTLALLQLGDRYPEPVFQALPSDARDAVSRIACDHVRELQHAWQETNELLSPVLERALASRGLSPGTEETPAHDSWRVRADGIARSLRHAETNIHQLFVVREGAPSGEVDVDATVAATERARAAIDQAVTALRLP